MKAKLSQQENEFLRLRIFIAREVKVFDLETLARSWAISRSSLLRYESEEYRQLSRLSSRRANLLEAQRDKTRCQICATPLMSHPRCSSCTMLFHGTKECGCVALTHVS